jgi:hypothetical protein
MLMVFVAVSAIAQTSIEIFNESDNTIILKLTTSKQQASQQKIVLVYDSNMIALESTSARAKNLLHNNSVPEGNSTSASSLSYLSETDTEEDIQIEGWMLKPFTPQYNTNEFSADKEEDIPLEAWMTDLSQWN